jgi:hypothetical protein
LQAKFPDLTSLRPDIAIVPECAKPEILWAKAPLLFNGSVAWIGDKKHKGLGVFGFGNYQVELDPCYDESITWIAPIRVSGPVNFNLLAVWALHENEPGERDAGVVGPLLRSLTAYRDFVAAAPLVVAGDFNNHVRWDRPDKKNNHANAVSRLEELGSVSAYHAAKGVAQGEDTDTTHYHTKSLEKRYHIDYCFVPKAWAINDCTVGSSSDWLKLSDHMPVAVEVIVP